MSTDTGHLDTRRLLDYWLGDADAASVDAVDEHLMQCDACGQALDELIALGDGVRAALREGMVSVALSRAFVQRLVAQGLRVREYRLPHNGSVNCTVAPDDDLLVSYLEAPLQGVQRLDAVTESSLEPGVRRQLQDLPFDARSGEVMFVPRTTHAKQETANTLQLTLLSVEAGGPREIGRYTYHHRPWPGAPGEGQPR